MPRKKYHEQIAESLQAEQPEETQTNDTEDLNDAKVQERIMSPDGTPIKLSYGSIVVYPYAMREKRRAGGFLTQVFADAIGGGSRSKDEFELRVASLLMRRDDLENELFRLAAVGCGKPGTMDSDSKVLPLVAEFQQKCNSADVIQLFAAVSDLAEFQAPKL